MDNISPLELSNIFKKVIIHNKERLAYGVADRERVKNQIERGEKPTGYRPKWVMSSARQVIDLLADVSIEFNQQNPKDKISLNDMVDVLLTALEKLKNSTDTD